MHECHYIAEGYRHLEGGSPANAGIDELDEQQDDHVKPIGYGGFHNDCQPYHDGHGHHQLQITPHKSLNMTCLHTRSFPR